MKITTIALFLSLIFAPQLLWAHGDGHGPELTSEDVANVGQVSLKYLVKDKLIAKSWGSDSVKLTTSEMQVIDGKNRWVLVYENPSETDVTKKMLKILLTPSGRFVSHSFLE